MKVLTEATATNWENIVLVRPKLVFVEWSPIFDKEICHTERIV